MKKEGYQVKAVSELLRVSPDTIRYYDKIGLLNSAREGSGAYRSFDAESLGNLLSVVQLRSMGVPIETIQRFFDNPSLPSLCEDLLATNDSLEEELKRISSQQRKLIRTYSNLCRVQTESTEIMLRTSPRWWMITACPPEPGALLGIFMDALENSDACPTYGYIRSRRQLEEDKDEYSAHCLLFDRDYHSEEFGTAELEPRRCACQVFKGDPRDRDLVQGTFSRIKGWIRENGYEIAGDALERYLLGGPSEAFMEIWIPVKKTG